MTFIEKAKIIHNNRYDYSLVNYVNSQTKVKIICPTHGIFEQTPNNHLMKRGCPYCAKNERKNTSWFIQKAKEVHNDHYDYSKANYVNMKTKVAIICSVHGTFYQTPDAHLRGQGCPICGREKCNKSRLSSNFLEKAKKLHPDFDYSLVNYTGADNKVKIICPNKHIFEQTPYKHLNCFQGCPYCKASSGEQLIISYLTERKINFKFQYVIEDCKDINPLPFDFYIPKLNLLIEFQGEQHYKPCNKFGGYKAFLKLKHHDWLKRKYCREHQIILLTISYKDCKIINKILEENIYGI